MWYGPVPCANEYVEVERSMIALLPKQNLGIAATLLAVMLVLAGATCDPEERQEPLLIGQLNALSGSLVYASPSLRNAAVLAADHVNRAGGIAGAPVVLISRDTGANVDQGIAAARALVDVESVTSILGARNSSVTIAVAEEVTVPKRRLQVSSTSSSPRISGLPDDDFLFRTTVSDAAQGGVLARLAREQGYKTAGVMYLNNAYGEGLTNQFATTFTELGGTITGKVPHEDSQPTFKSELEKATAGDPDVLVAISYPGQAEVYLREALAGGYADTFLFVDAIKSSEMIAAVGWEVLEGTLGTAAGSPPTTQSRAFTADYFDTYGGEQPTHAFIAHTYDAVALIALAAAKAGTTTDSAAIRDALRDVANPPGEVVGPGVAGIRRALALIAAGQAINYEGAAGPVDFDENGDVIGPIEIWKVEEGQIKSTGRFETP